ncbi:DUF6551 family protein [Pseudochelatococcus sp. B33]
MTLRQVAALRLPDITPAAISSTAPTVRLVEPSTLSVNEEYQRSLSDRSVRLIRKIVAEWDWRAFKPPVVVEVDDRLEVIDGQHTAIAAVTHGGIDRIPVLVVEATEQQERASAFVRHNRDRIAVTPTQLYNALLAAGDDDALTVAQVCERSGVRILQMPPGNGRYAQGDTMAVTTIRSMVARRYAKGAREVLEICAKSGFRPISADLIKAVEQLLFSPEYKAEIDGERIVHVLSARASTIKDEAARFAAERKLPFWRGLTSAIFMSRKKHRGG